MGVPRSVGTEARDTRAGQAHAEIMREHAARLEAQAAELRAAAVRVDAEVSSAAQERRAAV